ncbi:MAG TPA: hypothetical protein VJ385_12300 [Fibrobacteria bacterium]|nr:hypothetical protein [Fibrobacteria bacterium]
MTAFLREQGPWILSILAVAQFWIWFLLRKSGGRRRLELYESGSIEVGFDANGPLIALAGVLRPVDKEVFVQSVEVSLVADKDKARREFRWIAFKPNFLLPLAGAKAWEMPHPFLVSPGDTRRYNVVFHDVEGFRQVKGILQSYYHHWRETERRILEWRQRRGGPSLAGGAGFPPPEGKGDHEELISEFKKRDACVSAYTDLDQKCYWEQGSYGITVNVVTEGGTADYTKSFRFTLGKLDAKLLKGNCVTMLDEPIAATMNRIQAPCQVVQAEYDARETRA